MKEKFFLSFCFVFFVCKYQLWSVLVMEFAYENPIAGCGTLLTPSGSRIQCVLHDGPLTNVLECRFWAAVHLLCLLK